jgi:hypothetical protein
LSSLICLAERLNRQKEALERRMSSLMRHAGLSVRPMNLVRRLEEVLVRKKDGSKAQKTLVKAQMNPVDRQATVPKAQRTCVIRVTAGLKALLVRLIPQKNAVIRRMNPFTAQKAPFVRLSGLAIGRFVPFGGGIATQVQRGDVSGPNDPG